MKISFVYRFTLSLALATVFFTPAGAADDTGKVAEQLEDITVQATRVDKSLYEIPASVGYVGKDDIQFGRQQLGLDESLNRIPGLFMQNRYNFNQDLSISIRGFGKRAAFGIRGVRVYVDGIPNTLPDGQGSIDSIDIGSLDRAEVIRGPSSSLYGTASGGVINLYTEDGTDIPFIEARAQGGSYDFSQFQVKTGGQKGAFNYLVNVSRLNNEGFRDHSKIEKNTLNSKFRYDIDATSDFTLTANILDKPIANDPGGLCRTSTTAPFCTGLDAGRKKAQRNNERFDAEETVDQQQIGLRYRKTFNANHETILRNYYQWRDFDNKLPFGTPFATGGSVAFDRFFLGGGGQHIYTDSFFGHHNRLSIGFDIDSQMDDRKNFQNTSGSVGVLTLNQEEDVFSWGIYLQNEFALTDTLELSFGVRYDEVEFDFTDHFLANGDGSGKIKFTETSPQVGLLWKVHPAVNLYGTISTSFETPTSTEFVSPTGTGGFNQSLDAQTATNYEVGIKGVLPGQASYQLSFFTMDVSDELLPAGTNPAGNTFFNNAGETSRNGIEAGLSFRPLPGLDVTLNYTYSDFDFDKFTVGGVSFEGNRIPGIPKHFGFAEIAYYHPSGFNIALDAQAVDDIFVDNANSDAAAGYVISNLRLGYTRNIGNTEISPFLGLNNLFDKEYIGNVRVNEGNSRFFEPAPEFNVFGGITVTFR